MICLYCDKKVNGYGLCYKHYWRWRNRKPMEDSWHSRKPYTKSRKVNIDHGGYERTSLPGGGKLLIHRDIMAKALGRKLDSDEIVHHINGNKTDNRRENLQVVTKAEHIRLHPEIPSRGGKAKHARKA